MLTRDARGAGMPRELSSARGDHRAIRAQWRRPGERTRGRERREGAAPILIGGRGVGCWVLGVRCVVSV